MYISAFFFGLVSRPKRLAMLRPAVEGAGRGFLGISSGILPHLFLVSPLPFARFEVASHAVGRVGLNPDLMPSVPERAYQFPKLIAVGLAAKL